MSKALIVSLVFVLMASGLEATESLSPGSEPIKPEPIKPEPIKPEPSIPEPSIPGLPKPLPSPLTLDYLMQMDLQAHPQVQQARAEQQLSEASLLATEARTGFKSSISAAARYVEPPDSLNGSVEDHYAQFSLSKRLYDFGYSANTQEAASQLVNASQWNYVEQHNRHRISVMRRYFDVLLADLQFIRDNEAMSVAFVQMDRLRMRQGLGQRSDLDVLQAEERYQRSRVRFNQSRSMQRASRNALANIINRPGELASDVAEPKLKGLFDKLPEYDSLQKQMRQHNPVLKNLRLKLLAAEKNLAAARAVGRPSIDSLATYSEYERPLGSRNQWEVELKLKVPLWTGGESDAAVARQQALLMQQKAMLRQAEMDLGQELLQTVQRLELLKVEHAQMDSESEYRDLYLDRSRAFYELEWKTDLGDSMVRVSDVRLRMAKVRYQAALQRAHLNSLLGKPIFPVETDNETNKPKP